MIRLLTGLVLLAIAAWSQPSVNPHDFTCVANAGVPPTLRVEGITELVGDLVLQCTGGTPTPVGLPVPTSNISLTLNTNVTSRLLGASGYADAMLLIDEPYPANPIPNNIKPAPNAPPQVFCSFTSPCPSVIGTGGAGTYLNQPNAYEGKILGNAVTWDGVPIDAPPTTGIRVVRITNVRANASQLGLSSTLIPTQIVGFISVNGGNFSINNPYQTLGFIQQGLSVTNSTATLAQCNSLNPGAGNSGVDVQPSFNINVREGFAQSFKRANVGIIPDLNAGAPLFIPQNIPGFAYNTESSFYPQTPAGVGNANFGTRILLRFNNVGTGRGNGPFILLPTVVPLMQNGKSTPSTPPPPPAGVSPGVLNGFLRLITSTDGPGAYSPAAPIPGTLGGVPMAEVSYSQGIGSAVYEIVNSDPTAIESATIPVGVAFISDPTQNLPAVGNSTINVSFAPANAADISASATSPIPRFIAAPSPNGVPFSGYTIRSCSTNASQLMAGGGTSLTLDLSARAGDPTEIRDVIPLATTGPAVTGLSANVQINNGPGAHSTEPSPSALSGSQAQAAGAPWITATLNQTATPADLVLVLHPQGLAAGKYSATVTVTATNATNPSLPIPVTLTVAGTQPVISVAGVTNAASNRTTAVTPGMFITIYGSNFGPATLNDQRFLGNSGVLWDTLSSTRVIFDNKYTAPMIYATNGQLSALVPYEIAGQLTTQVVVEYLGLQSAPVTVPVTDAAPALFTADASGSGQAAALNADFSYNNSSNPVEVGSFILLFGTGEGQTKPPGQTGAVNLNPVQLSAPVLPVSARVGNVEVTPAYFGGVYGQLDGFLQVNLQIPPGVGPGDVPVVIRVNGKESPLVTISVK